jgi:HSP20 family protein
MAPQAQKNVPAESARERGDGGALSIDRLYSEMDRFFDDMRRSLLPTSFGRLLDFEPLRRLETAYGTLTPRVDVTEDEKAIEIAAELPGLAEKDVELVVEGGMLTIKGEKSEEKKEEKKEYHLTERRYGAFRRSFTLPDTVDEDKIAASFDKGVLKVTLPKRPEAVAKSKWIPIGSK